ncbi:hypothetical protein ACLHDG_05015 [Sulfurovum sp. CS9]|uniref:hypothetical protein n=1 Tax=Sulfurovum sp. CS9 TaxID=3391146 RepID=UPI0039EB9834
MNFKIISAITICLALLLSTSQLIFAESDQMLKQLRIAQDKEFLELKKKYNQSVPRRSNGTIDTSSREYKALAREYSAKRTDIISKYIHLDAPRKSELQSILNNKNYKNRIVNTGSAPANVNADIDLKANDIDAAKRLSDHWNRQKKGRPIEYYTIDDPKTPKINPPKNWKNVVKVVNPNTDTTLWTPETEAIRNAKIRDHDAWTTSGGLKGTGNREMSRDKMGYYLDNEKKFIHADQPVTGTAGTHNENLKTLSKSVSKAGGPNGANIAQGNRKFYEQARIMQEYGDPYVAGIVDHGDSPNVRNRKIEAWKQTARSEMNKARIKSEKLGHAADKARAELAEQMRKQGKNSIAERIEKHRKKVADSNRAAAAENERLAAGTKKTTKGQKSSQANGQKDKNAIQNSDKGNLASGEKTSLGQKVRDGVNRYGEHILFATVNFEMILNCKEKGTSARDCLVQLMVSNGLAASVSIAMQLLAQGTVIEVAIVKLVGKVFIPVAVVKATYDTAKILYSAQDYASAEWNRYQIEENRTKWTRINLESGSLEYLIKALHSKITATLEPLVTEIASGCDKLLRYQAGIQEFAISAKVKFIKLPSSENVAELKKLEDRIFNLMLEERRFTKVLDKASASLGQLKINLKQASDAAQNCSSENDAQTIDLKYDAAKINLEEIEQVKKEAKAIGDKVQSLEKEIQQAKITLKSAFAMKDYISDMNAKIPAYEQIESNINKVNTATKQLEDKGIRLSTEVKALRFAFPDDLDSKTEKQIHKLDELITKLQSKEKGCDTNSYQDHYNKFAGAAVTAKLDAENRLRPIEPLLLILSHLKTWQTEKNWTTIQAIQKEASQLIQIHQGLIQKAADCRKAILSGNDINSSDNDKDSPDEDEKKDSNLSESNDDSELKDKEDKNDSVDDSSGDSSNSESPDESDSKEKKTQDTTDASPVETDKYSNESNDPSWDTNVETVTYFDRDFIPQSWKTSGNSQEVRVHLFSLGSRLGWSAALAQHSGSPAINQIIDHLSGASVHVKGAYDNSYMPMKTYKDWQQIQRKHQYWSKLLKRKPNMQGRERQLKSLSWSFRSHAMGLASRIAYQSWGHGLEKQENCDSYYLRIGYYLAYASQSLTYAVQSQAKGMPKKLVRKIINDGKNAAASAARYMRNLKKLRLATGYCIDLSTIADRVFQGTRGGKTLPVMAKEAHKGWEDTLKALGGLSLSLSPDNTDIKNIGQYVFADMKKLLPQGAEKVHQGTYDEVKNIFGYFKENAYNFSYSKAFKVKDKNILDYNPGFYFYLEYEKSIIEKIELKGCVERGHSLSVLKNEKFARHGGKGGYCLKKYIAVDGEETLYPYILWRFGHWSISMSGQDKPNHPATMFGRGNASLKYMLRVLDHLVPRLRKAVEMYGVSEKMKGDEPIKPKLSTKAYLDSISADKYLDEINQ